MGRTVVEKGQLAQGTTVRFTLYRPNRPECGCATFALERFAALAQRRPT